VDAGESPGGSASICQPHATYGQSHSSNHARHFHEYRRDVHGSPASLPPPRRPPPPQSQRPRPPLPSAVRPLPVRYAIRAPCASCRDGCVCASSYGSSTCELHRAHTLCILQGRLPVFPRPSLQAMAYAHSVHLTGRGGHTLTPPGHKSLNHPVSILHANTRSLAHHPPAPTSALPPSGPPTA
jgi:hypothetical protein